MTTTMKVMLTMITKRSEQNDSFPQTTAVVKRLWVTKQAMATEETFMKQW